MAQKVLVQLVDDLDGTTSQDVSTVLFGLDGVSFEIDLSERNAENLREGLADFIGHARRTGGRINRSRNGHAPARGNSDAAAIREWAAANQIQVSPRGRIPKSVVEQYHEAKEAEKAAAAKPPARNTRKSTTRRAKL